MTNKEAPIPGNSEPAQSVSGPDRFDTPMWRSIKKGTPVGFAIGFAIAQYIVTTQVTETPVGALYEGNVLLLFAVWVGLGSAVGAGVGWFNARSNEKK